MAGSSGDPTSSLADVLRLATVDSEASTTRGTSGALARAEQSAAAEAAVSSALRARHLAGLPYTWLADGVLLCCNPQRPLGAAHGRAQIARHASLPTGSRAADPHIFAVAEAAVRKALDGESACVCVLGESGAGKTEASKLALLHLLHRAGELRGLGGGGPDEKLRQALLMSRAVVEAMTHSATPACGNATRIALATRLWFEPAAVDAPALVVAAQLECLGLSPSLAVRPSPARAHPLRLTCSPSPALPCCGQALGKCCQ